VGLGGHRPPEDRFDGPELDGGPRPEPPESTRGRLIEAASALFAERGYERTSIQDIAREAGLTTGAIYSNFRGKRDVLMAAIAAPAEAMGATVRDARRAGASALDLIRVGAHRLVSGRGRRERPILVNALVLAARDPIVGQMLRKGLARTFREFARMVEAGQAEGSISPDVDIDAYTHYAYAVTFGAYLLEAAGVPAPDQEAWDRLMDRLLTVLAPAGTAEPERSGQAGALARGGT